MTKYEWYKAHGICPTCGWECCPWTGAVSGMSHAVQCDGKPGAKRMPQSAPPRRTDLLHAFGVCVDVNGRCRRTRTEAYCLARSRRYMQSRLREKGVMPRDMLGWPGICSRCGKPTNTQEAHKLCPACREASQHAMEIARNSRTEKNWFARTHSLMAWGKP